MPLIHRDIPGLYNGVSQQAPPLRLPNQMEEQINFLSSVTSGMEKRQGTRHIANLTGSHCNRNTLSFPFRDSEGVEYLVLFTGNSVEPIEIYHKDGTKCVVTYETEASKSYLLTNSSGIPRNDLRVSAIADYALVVNRNVVCAMSTKRSPIQPKYALYWIERGFTSTTYTLGDKSHTTADGTTTTDSSTTQICAAMCSLVTGLTQLNGGSVARITGDAVDSLTCSDSYGNQASKLIKGKVAKEEDLPPCAADGDVIEVTGDKNDTLTGYYVRWSTEDNMWVECVQPDLQCELDASTMPHQLIRKDTSTFLFRPSVENETEKYPGWQERKVGNEISAPTPSFIGFTIKDIFYYKNRLGVISGQNIVMSQPNDYFNFFPSTTAVSLDTDPLDRAIGFNEPAILEWATPFKENLLLFSKDRQFIMTSGLEVFTSKNAMIDLVTTYPCSTKVRPVSLGSSIMFASDTGGNSLVREYFVESETLQNSAADVTAHCPRYLPCGISRAVHLPNAGVLLYWSEQRPKELSVYSYFWSGNEKPQSSWSTFRFPFEILAMEQFEETLYLVLKESEGSVRLSALEIANDDWLLMDERFEPESVTYDANTNSTTILFPYPTACSVFPALVYPDGRVYLGLTVLNSSETSLTVAGNVSDGSVICGIPFESSFTLSEFFVSPEGKTGMLQGRLMLKSLTLSFLRTGAFQVEVNYPGRTSMTHRYTGVVLGESKLSTASLRSERKRFMTYGDSKQISITVKNDGVLPSTFDSLSFEGLLHTRTQRT